MQRGRKNKYETCVKPCLDKISYWRKDGLTERQIVKRLGVAYSTFNKYKTEEIELMEALKKGKDELIHELEDSLYKRAKGFEYEEIKTLKEKTQDGKEKIKKEINKKYMAADTTAIIFALKILKPEKYQTFEINKKEINEAKLELEQQRFEHQKEIDNNKIW